MNGISISAPRLLGGAPRGKALITALCVAVALAGGADRADGATVMAGEESCLVSRINGERAGAGLPPLAVHSGLVSIARRYSTHMAENMAPRTWVHNANLANEMPSGWKTRGENVGWATDCGYMHNFFINSPAHRKNILGPGFNYVGVGVVKDAQGDLRVTQVFMGTGQATQSSPASAPAAKSPSPAVDPPAPPKPAVSSLKTPTPANPSSQPTPVKPLKTTVASEQLKRGKTRAYMDSLEKEPEALEAIDTGEITFELPL